MPGRAVRRIGARLDGDAMTRRPLPDHFQLPQVELWSSARNGLHKWRRRGASVAFAAERGAQR